MKKQIWGVLLVGTVVISGFLYNQGQIGQEGGIIMDAVAAEQKAENSVLSVVKNEQHGDWRLIGIKNNQNGAEQYNLIQERRAKNGQVVIKVEVLKAAKGSKTDKQILLHLPLGLELAKGAKLIVGSVGKKMDFHTCLPAGCQARVDLDSSLHNALSKGKDAAVEVYAQGGTQKIKIEFSLEGYSKGVKEVK